MRFKPHTISCTIFSLSMIGVFLLPDMSLCDDRFKFEPYIKSYPIGKIDWDKGIIYGVGRGYLHMNSGSKAKALRVGQLLALQSIIELASGIRLDDRSTLESLGKGKVILSIQSIIRYEEHETRLIDSVKEPYYEVIRRSPIKGFEGLSSKLLTHFKSFPSIWEDFPLPSYASEPDDETEPWLVLNAMNIQPDTIIPALFPRIIDETGKLVYGLKHVSESALLKRGMMRYVVSEKPLPGYKSDSRLNSFLKPIFSTSEVFAEEEKAKREKRKTYIVTDVKQAEGISKTNLVISESDAQKLKTEDTSSKILKNCRVIVVLNSPMGGIEGCLPFRLVKRWLQQ